MQHSTTQLTETAAALRTARPRPSLAAWSGGTLLVLGVILFALNWFAGVHSDWWALFVALPGFVLLATAWGTARWSGSFGLVARLLAALGLIVLAVAALFLLGLSWSRWWPVMVSVPGCALVLIGWRPHDLAVRPNLTAVAAVTRWIGLSLLLLGATFLAGSFGLINLADWTQRLNWWGLFMLLPAVGVLWTAVRLFAAQRPITGVWMLVLAMAIAVTAVVELFDLGLSVTTAGLLLLGSGVTLVLAGLRG